MPDNEITKTFLGYVLGPTGVVFLLLTFVYGLLKEWWVMGPSYRRSTEREDRLEKMMYRTFEKMESFADVTTDAVKKIH